MYLQQAFRGNNKFSRYFITTIILILSTQILGALPALAAMLYGVMSGGTVNPNNPSDFASLGIDQNLGLALMLIPFAVGFFALLICIRKLHSKKVMDVITTRPKFDFSRAAKGGILWGAFIIISALPSILADDGSVTFNFDPIPFFTLCIVCLLLLPLQTSFEELLFRGYYMQGFAVTTNTRWAPLLVTSIAFGLLHSMNPEVKEFGFWMAMPSYVFMGLIMGIVAVMDNGLEIALGMHFSNNFISALLFTSPVSALQTPALFTDNDPSMSYSDNIIMLITGIAFILLCSKIFKWKDWNKIFKPVVVK